MCRLERCPSGTGSDAVAVPRGCLLEDDHAGCLYLLRRAGS